MTAQCPRLTLAFLATPAPRSTSPCLCQTLPCYAIQGRHLPFRSAHRPCRSRLSTALPSLRNALHRHALPPLCTSALISAKASLRHALTALAPLRFALPLLCRSLLNKASPARRHSIPLQNATRPVTAFAAQRLAHRCLHRTEQSKASATQTQPCGSSPSRNPSSLGVSPPLLFQSPPVLAAANLSVSMPLRGITLSNFAITHQRLAVQRLRLLKCLAFSALISASPLLTAALLSISRPCPCPYPSSFSSR